MSKHSKKEQVRAQVGENQANRFGHREPRQEVRDKRPGITVFPGRDKPVAPCPAACIHNHTYKRFINECTFKQLRTLSALI